MQKSVASLKFKLSRKKRRSGTFFQNQTSWKVSIISFVKSSVQKTPSVAITQRRPIIERKLESPKIHDYSSGNGASD